MSVDRSSLVVVIYYFSTPIQISTMTNKNKKTTTKKIKEPKEVVEAPEMLGPTGIVNFTRAQIAAMVFLSIGCTKLMEFNTAYNEGYETPTSCLVYLGEGNADTCTHPSFPSLILAKYYSGLSLVGYLLAGMLMLWNSEELFQKFMSCLALGPVATTTVATIAVQPYLEKGRVWHLLVVASVLYATIAPQAVSQVPFVTERLQVNPKSMQSITLMGLIAFASWEIFSIIFSSDTAANSLLDTASPLPQAAKALVSFWMVDKFSMVLLYAFALFHFEPSNQRAFLFITAVIKACEFYIQLRSMDEPFQNEGLIEAASITSAVASAVAFYGP
jgi:hypothetical protein